MYRTLYPFGISRFFAVFFFFFAVFFAIFFAIFLVGSSCLLEVCVLICLYKESLRGVVMIWKDPVNKIGGEYLSCFGRVVRVEARTSVIIDHEEERGVGGRLPLP